jgi:hypothetical protein
MGKEGDRITLFSQANGWHMRDRRRSEVNLLDLIPERIIEFEVDEACIVTILAPRFRNRLMKLLFAQRLSSRHIKVKLDDIGSEVWLLCDGTRNVKEIAELLTEKFKERIEPCHDRLGVFFQQLEMARFISYKNLGQCLKARGS